MALHETDDLVDVSGLRINYMDSGVLLEKDVCKDPIIQFNKWMKAAMADPTILEPNAMTLATASSFGVPSARIVLLKDFSDHGFTFYSNYDSAKGKNLDENPVASLMFYWEPQHRCVRINGTVTKTTPEESDQYFNSRPLKSRIGACASKQSEVIASKEVIQKQFNDLAEKYSADNGNEDVLVPRPASWGGYTVRPTTIEFWQGGKDRMHDRILYTKVVGSVPEWKIERLSP